LLRVEKLPPSIWEPCSGYGNVAKVLRHHGHTVVCSDVHEYVGFNLDFVGDFLQQTEMPAGAQAICTNPPYSLCARSAPFVQQALDLAPTVILLMRLAFPESEARCSILEERGLRSIHIFRLRLPMMHREGWEGRKANSGMAFCWMRWDRGYTGPIIMDRISWER
jgi:hypothetical protein